MGSTITVLAQCVVAMDGNRDKLLCDKAVSSVAFLFSLLKSPCSLPDSEIFPCYHLWISHICAEGVASTDLPRNWGKTVPKSCLNARFPGWSHHPHSLKRRQDVPQETHGTLHGGVGPSCRSALPRGWVLHWKLNIDWGNLGETIPSELCPDAELGKFKVSTEISFYLQDNNLPLLVLGKTCPLIAHILVAVLYGLCSSLTR